jgi:hypothetical protein
MRRKLNFRGGTKRLADGYAQNEEMLSWTSHLEGSRYADEKYKLEQLVTLLREVEIEIAN